MDRDVSQMFIAAGLARMHRGRLIPIMRGGDHDPSSEVLSIARELKQTLDGRFAGLERRLRVIEVGEGYTPGDTPSRSSAAGRSGSVEHGGFAAWLQSTLVEGTAALGGHIVPPEHSDEIFSTLISRSVLLASGVRVIETSSDELHLPIIADDTANWTAEATAIAETQPVFSEVVARPRKLAAYVELSNELVADSSPAALSVVSDSFLRAMAAELDVGMFAGTGTAPQIRGLLNQTVPLPATAADVTIDDLDSVLEAFALIEAAGFEPTAVYMSPTSWAAFMGLKEVTGSIRPLLSEPSLAERVRRNILGVPVYLSPAMPDTEILVAQSDQIVAVRREEARVEVSSDVAFREDVTAVRAVSRWDVVVPVPAATAVIPIGA